MQDLWSYDLETRCPEIDNDHKEVMRLLGDFLRTVDMGGVPQITTSLDGLWARVVAHFAREQHMMSHCTYAQRADHAEAHASFLKDMQRAQKELATKGLTSSFHQWAFGRLSTWFVSHIRTYDIGLAQAIRRYDEAVQPFAPTD